MSVQVFGLADCSNFFASCEKLFRPDLKHVPVVVMSSNDGCVIARSREAKALGFKMGQPFFECREMIERNGVEVFSSNFTLYGDISQRVMSILEQLSPKISIYSVDEAFLDATGIPDLLGFGRHIRGTVLQWTGIEVGVGFAQTKTLAKLANHAAKQYPATGGVVDLTDRQRQLRLMKLVPVGEVWGVGRRYAEKLAGMDIQSALDLAQADPKTIRRHFSVVLERTVAELNGESCQDLEEIAPASQQIIRSRSFGSRITELAQMRQAITAFMSKAAEKLRQEQQVAKRLSVFIRTSPFGTMEPQYSNQASIALVTATSDTRDLVASAMRLLDGIWKDGYRYAKGGVMLAELRPEGAVQADLFAAEERPRSEALMKVIDQINRSGQGRVFLAGQGMRQEWDMRRKYLSPAYTTRWEDLPRVR